MAKRHMVSLSGVAGIEVVVYMGEDGCPVVDIIGPAEEHLNQDTSPKIRIYLNEARIYNGTDYEGGSVDD